MATRSPAKKRQSSMRKTVKDQSGAGKIKIGELLSKAGYITPGQLENAKKILKQKGGRLGAILRQLEYIDDNTVFNFLSRQHNYPAVIIKDEPPAKDALELLSRNGVHLDISPGISNTEIFQDEIKFRQIVGNLLKNALHHRREKLEITMDLENEIVSLTVSDDGPGVEPDHHEMIFKRYAQVKECSIVPRKGHGLGLAGALILARCLGGDIKIVSEKGQGAAFCLTLPVSMAGE